MMSASASCVSSITDGGGDVAAADVLLERQIEQPLNRRGVPGGRINAHALAAPRSWPILEPASRAAWPRAAGAGRG